MHSCMQNESRMHTEGERETGNGENEKHDMNEEEAPCRDMLAACSKTFYVCVYMKYTKDQKSIFKELNVLDMF